SLLLDPVTNTFSPTGDPLPNLVKLSVINDRMLVLPTGQVLLYAGGAFAVYTSDESPVAAGQPAVSAVTENADGSFLLSGTLLNGISEGAAYGDDAGMSSNYPIVRLTSPGGTVSYARTYNWSSTGVATGSTPVSTDFTLPLGLPADTYALSVVANGIASAPVS